MFHNQEIHDEMFRKMMNDLFPPLPQQPIQPIQPPPIPKSDKNYYEGRYGTQAIDIIEEFNLNFNLGSVIKYVLRSYLKEDSITLSDLRKAQYYLEREISNIEERDE